MSIEFKDPQMLEVVEFLNRIYRLSEVGDEHGAADEVFNFMDDHLLDEQFPICDEVFDQVEVEKILAPVMVSFLMVTRKAKDELPARKEFLERATQFLAKERGSERAERLLGKYR